MNKLIIVGNGFDLAHGLPTGYANFIEYLIHKGSCYGSYHLNKYQKFYKDITNYIAAEELWSSFEKALELLDEEELKNDNRCYLKGYGDENWSDSAHHDYQNMIEESLSFSAHIAAYMRDWIIGIDTRTHAFDIPCSIMRNDNIFLSFNYTNTLESTYNISPNSIWYIHGKALRGDRLIVGHHNDSLLYNKDAMPEFQTYEEEIEFYENQVDDVRIIEAEDHIREYYKKTFKDTRQIINQNMCFFQSLARINEIYVYGHSLSEIDFDYFYEIKLRVIPSCRWNFSYHNRTDRLRIQKLVQRLDIQNYSDFFF